MAKRSRKRPLRSPTRPGQDAAQSSSTSWFDLPLEMREMVIDRMDPKTRCIFAQCSKWCEYEAKKSKNYLYKITITEDMGNNYELQLLLFHSKYFNCDYWFEFVNSGENRTLVEYKKNTVSGKILKWSKIESGKPENVRLKYFNDYTDKFNHSIRSFHFNHFKSSVTDYNIKNLKHLKELIILPDPFQDGRIEVLNLIECGFIKMEQLIWVKTLIAPELKLTFEKIAELNGEEIDVNSDDFDEANTNKYLKKMKKGEILENAKSIDIIIRQRNIIRNVRNVMNGLDAFNYSETESENENGESRILYTFDFLSDVKKNGTFRLFLTPQVMIGISWISNSTINLKI